MEYVILAILFVLSIGVYAVYYMRKPAKDTDANQSCGLLEELDRILSEEEMEIQNEENQNK